MESEARTDSRHSSAVSPTPQQEQAPVLGRAPGRIGLLIFLLGVFVAALYAFVLYPRQSAIEPIIDLNGFGALGRHLARGDGFSLGYGPTLRRAPLYPAFVAGLLKIFGCDGPDDAVYRPVIAAQCALVGLTCLTCWATARKIFGAQVGLVAGLLCALAPQVWRYVPMTEVETSLGFLIVLLALTGLNLYREPTTRNGILFGLVAGAATLVKPVVLLYPFVFALALGLRWRQPSLVPAESGKRAGDGEEGGGLELRGRQARKANPPSSFVTLAAMLIVFLLCLLPWSLRNGLLTGGQFWSISSNAPGEFLRGYVLAQPKFYRLRQDFGGANSATTQWDWEANLYEESLLKPHGLSMFSRERFAPNGDPLQAEPRWQTEVAKERVEKTEARRRVLSTPGAFGQKVGVQLFTFWYIVETRKKSLLVGGMALACLALAVFGGIRARRQRKDTLPVVCVVLYFNLLYAAILAFARYSMPLYPTLLILSAYGLTQLRLRSENKTLE